MYVIEGWDLSGVEVVVVNIIIIGGVIEMCE